MRRTSAGRRFEGSAGLFGAYGFVLIEARWYDVRWSPGVASVILGADGRPARVADEVIASLRAREDAGGFIVLERRPEFEKGRQRAAPGPCGALRGVKELRAGARASGAARLRAHRQLVAERHPARDGAVGILLVPG